MCWRFLSNENKLSNHRRCVPGHSPTPASELRPACQLRGDRVHCEQSAQRLYFIDEGALVGQSWWINDCRWSSVRVGTWNDALASSLSPTNCGCDSLPVTSLSSLLCSRKCSVHFPSQVKVVSRHRNSRHCFWPSCYPTDRAWNRSKGAHQSDAGTHKHSFPLPCEQTTQTPWLSLWIH